MIGGHKIAKGVVRALRFFQLHKALTRRDPPYRHHPNIWMPISFGDERRTDAPTRQRNFINDPTVSAFVGMGIATLSDDGTRIDITPQGAALQPLEP